MKDFYTAQWPKYDLYIECFVHSIMNFRYHWHQDDFELSILLHGKQYFCRGKENFCLEEDDVILVDANEGHASYGQETNTKALVLHFSSKALRQFLRKGEMYSFSQCCSDADTRDSLVYQRIRFYAAQIIRALSEGGPYAQYTARAAQEMLIATLCSCFEPRVIPWAPEADQDLQKMMRGIMEYLESHYQEKITLEDIARITQYNRTYISTLFKKVVGIPFYEYLMRVRFQHALADLTASEKTLTDIALSNGFADLKSFNARFREILHCLPSDYKSRLDENLIISDYHSRKLVPCSDPMVQQKLKVYCQEF